MDVIEELSRIVAPFDASIIIAALDGKATIFDVDGEWYAHHHGRPRCIGKLPAFDGDAMLAGIQAVCWLATQLPVGDARRLAVPALYDKIRARLANPELMIYSGSPDREELTGPPHRSFDYRGQPEHEGVDLGGIVDARGYLYFRPARLQDPSQLALARLGAELHYPNQTFPWSGVFHAWQTIATPGVQALVARATATPLGAGAYEIDPRQSVPSLVAEVARAHGLDGDAATLYLQLLTLPDCGDAWLRAVNGWTKPQHDQAGAQLLAKQLVVEAKQPRANRKLALAGTWEKLFPPHPAIERWKLELYDARMEGKALAAPLGRVLPLRPVHELFAAAWARVTGGASPTANRPVDGGTAAEARDWIAELRAAPEDDALRAVWGDWLSERGDPRGELVSLQLRRAALARSDGEHAADSAALVAAEAALIERHGEVWSEAFHPFVESYRFDRGVITSVTARALLFAKHAPAIMAALPLLEELVPFNTVGMIPKKHVEALGACREFAGIARLDFTPDRYLATLDDLRALLAGRHLPRLRYLRLGYHRPGEGWGVAGAEAIAACERFSELRFLEIAGNALGRAGVAALLASPQLARLEVLRVPYNDLRAGDVAALVAQLEAGALPSLRVLDVSNTLEAESVTRACSFQRNRIDAAGQERLRRALAARHGAISDGNATSSAPAAHASSAQMSSAHVSSASVASAGVLAQSGRFPFVERAKSGRSACVVCGAKIASGELRIGIERVLDAVGKVTSWLHPTCRATCPELTPIADLDARLTATSPALWPPRD